MSLSKALRNKEGLQEFFESLSVDAYNARDIAQRAFDESCPTKNDVKEILKEKVSKLQDEVEMYETRVKRLTLEIRDWKWLTEAWEFLK